MTDFSIRLTPQLLDCLRTSLKLPVSRSFWRPSQ